MPAPKTSDAEYRHSERAFDEVEGERGEPATRAEQQPHRENSEVLQRQRNWRG
jgi:hypothetical protein